jgi:uncharacterized damage-inducible protein DinB
MKDQLLETWAIHNRMNLLLLDNISDDGLQLSLSTRGGRTVRQQFIHIHNVRLTWLEIAAPAIYKSQTVLNKDPIYGRDQLNKYIEVSGAAISELLSQGWENGGKIKGFKKGVLALLGYFISHESHHRGNILLTLKQSGAKIPDAVKWGLWEWGK